ncbi:MAG: cobalamin-dependent protein, partial [Bdellovibrionota bacterium]
MYERPASAEIVLATLNARYHHTAFGLRSLRANLGPGLRARSAISEFTTSESPKNIVSRLLALSPKIVGFGVYIWNIETTTKVVSLLKRVAPQIQIVLGGPEISYETETQTILKDVDYVICGEGEVAFRELCAELLDGIPPVAIAGHAKVIAAPLPDIAALVLPYDEYTEEDLAQRILYVEASRGCPYKCEY